MITLNLLKIDSLNYDKKIYIFSNFKYKFLLNLFILFYFILYKKNFKMLNLLKSERNFKISKNYYF